MSQRKSRLATLIHLNSVNDWDSMNIVHHEKDYLNING